MFSKKPSRNSRVVPPHGGMYSQQYGQDMNFFDQGQFPQGPMVPQQMANESSLYPNTQFEKLQFEINENRRRINNLNRRITRLENYLRIRDDSDYSLGDNGENSRDFSTKFF
ncbi:MAG: hypothetical protein PHX62_03175 [Bacilli bacterium]|nr:hypothetical protein [Bacilli bacterium]